MKRFQSILCALLLTAAMTSTAFGGTITTRTGTITTAPGTITTAPGTITTESIPELLGMLLMIIG